MSLFTVSAKLSISSTLLFNTILYTIHEMTRTATGTPNVPQHDSLLREKPPYMIAAPRDGGLQAWTQVLMAHLILFCTWGFINSFGFFQAYYKETMSVDAAQISWVVSIQVFLLSFTESFSGCLMGCGVLSLLSDRWLYLSDRRNIYGVTV